MILINPIIMLIQQSFYFILPTPNKGFLVKIARVSVPKP